MNKFLSLLSAATVLALGGQAQATELVTNGSFEQTTNGAGEFGPHGGTTATGWTSSGYNFIIAAGSADTTGAHSTQYNNQMALWGPNNGSANGLPAASPDGGNFIGEDGAYQTGALSQTINGLVAGQKYAVSFDWAGAQQHGFDGKNTEQFIVSLGDESKATKVYHNPSHGFSGWMQQTFVFTATDSSETLSFLAKGTPNGVPPFSLLDGVSMTASVPEPATWTMMILGIGGVGAIARRRRAAGLAAGAAAA